MKKILVTGGTGFVGLALVRRLAAIGLSVVVVGRHHSDEVEKLGAIMACGDIRNSSFINEVSNGCDTIFHTAAKAGIWGDFADYYSTNVVGTNNIIAACQANRISRLIYTSTPSVVFDQTDIKGGNEELPFPSKFLCNYAKTKCMAEQNILKAQTDYLQTVALRPHLIWGPGDTNLIPRLLERGRKGLIKQVGNGSNIVDISYIDNVVEAHIAACRNLEENGICGGKAYFISQGEPVNLWSWINTLFKRLEIPLVTKKISFRQAYIGGLIIERVYKILRIKKEPLMTRFLAEQFAKSHWFSIENARNDFGYQSTISTEMGMNRLVKWLLETKT